jgi:hypothetical protein
MGSSERWGTRADQQAFLDAARQVLNAHVYCVSLTTSRTVDDSSLSEIAREVLRDPGLAVLLTAVVLEEDPIPEYLRCPYTPWVGLDSAQISMLNELSARKRLESMLVPRAPYRAPYGNATSAERAATLVSSFLDSFRPRPKHFVEVDKAVLRNWIWVERSHHAPPFPDVLDMSALSDGYDVAPFLQGSNDSVMAMAVGSRLALLINNGSD